MKIFIARCPVTVGFIYRVLMFIKHTTCYEEMIGYVNQVWGERIMWLSDFEEAIAAIKEHCNYDCFDSVAASAFGDSFIFQPRGPKDFYFVYFRDSKKIVKQYFDTWRKPDHYEVIYEGDK